MRAPLSIIIPTLNAEGGLPVVLGTLIEGLEGGLIRELVVSDGGSGDASCELAEAAGAEVVRGAAGRGGQLRRGADVARGEWLLFLHADTELSAGWASVVQAHIGGGQGAGYFRLAFDADGFAPRWVAGWANLRARLFGLPYGDQGLLISRDLYDAVGGYADMPLMEDVAMARSLRGQLRMLPVVARTSAARYRQAGWLRQGGRNLWRLLRYLAGGDVDRLGRGY
ncbi:TIGR04283 family arsenosugar biosynthesis glycosyltransferase [Profundibacter sp.]|uniref:TIGR04283 family arsenosugar biosynthesis glycosyltransferase n=1 Tax=Profundibacter sp. TaxID=3101071 RepID=UPI003D099631